MSQIHSDSLLKMHNANLPSNDLQKENAPFISSKMEELRLNGATKQVLSASVAHTGDLIHRLKNKDFKIFSFTVWKTKGINFEKFEDHVNIKHEYYIYKHDIRDGNKEKSLEKSGLEDVIINRFI